MSNLLNKVLFIGPYPPPYSGPETAMKGLLDSSISERFEIHFLKTNVRTSNEEKGKIDLKIVFAFFSFITRLLFMLTYHKPKAVYYFVTATRTGWLGRDVWCILISRLFGTKVIIHMRAGHFKYNYDKLNVIEKKIIKYACSKVSLGLVQSDNLVSQFQGLIDDNKIKSIYNAIDTLKYSNNLINEYDPNMIFFLGHLSFAKGYCDILKIMPEVVQEFPDVKFCFAGTKLKDERNVFYNQITGEKIITEDPDVIYKKYINNKYEKNYLYMGNVGEDEKINILKKCCCLILPSYSEGFSMSVLEGLSIGKPIVYTPVGALGEIIKDRVNGLLCNPGDLQQLKKNILEILADRQLRDNISSNNKVYAKETFDISIIADKLGKVFEDIL